MYQNYNVFKKHKKNHTENQPDGTPLGGILGGRMTRVGAAGGGLQAHTTPISGPLTIKGTHCIAEFQNLLKLTLKFS